MTTLFMSVCVSVFRCDMCVCACVRELVKEDDGSKSHMKTRARLALAELASKERTDVPAVTLDG